MTLVRNPARESNYEPEDSPSNIDGEEKRLFLARKGAFTLRNKRDVELDRRGGSISGSAGSRVKVGENVGVDGSDNDLVGAESEAQEHRKLMLGRVDMGSVAGIRVAFRHISCIISEWMESAKYTRGGRLRYLVRSGVGGSPR